MSAGLNTWWATPVKPSAHFTVEELERSERYHQPLRMVGAGAVVARLLLLLVGSWLVGRSDLTGDPSSDTASAGGGLSRGADGLADAGFLEVAGSGRLWVGAGMVALALRLPAIGADLWYEYRFSRRRLDQPGSTATEWAPVPIGRFLATVTALAGLTWFALVIVGGVGYRLAAATDRWPVVAAALVGFGLALATAVERPIRAWLPGSPAPIGRSAGQPDGFGESDGPGSPEDPGRRLAGLAAAFGLPGLDFLVAEQQPEDTVLSGSSPANTMAGDGTEPANAHAAGVGRHRRVVVTGALLVEPEPVRDFVVAHELSHVARRHVLMQTVLSGAAVILVIQGLAVVARWGRPWRTLGLEPFDPAAMPMTVFLLLVLAGVVTPVISLVARRQERVADSDAIAALGPLAPNQARRLLGHTRTDLSPPWWIRLNAHHPTPAERLEFMARHRR